MLIDSFWGWILLTKHEFLKRLEKAIRKLPKEERNRFLSYYKEMIEDRVEDGLTEEQAVAEMEDISVIADRILEELKQKKKKGWIWAAISSPIWVPVLAIGICAICVVGLAVYCCVIALLLCGLVGCIGLAGAIIGGGDIASGVFTLGVGLALMGIGLLLLGPVNRGAKATTSAIKRLWHKRRGKETAEEVR